MKRGNGFTLIELMTSIAILTVVVAATVGILVQAQRAASGVALAANTQENLRAGMHFLVRDLMQAGEGVPPGGILIPTNTSGVSNLNRPGIITTPATTFSTSNSVLYVISPGSAVGQDAKTVSASTNAVLDGGLQTDIINVIYADNTLIDASGHYLNSYSVASAASPVCGGTINASGTSVTLASSCFTMPGGPTPIAPGNLMLFTNVNGTALEYVTSVSNQTINFASSDPTNGADPSGLNGLSAATYTNGTVAAIKASTTSTTITRVWMVTYYIDSTTNPSRPQLIRQVNYPGFPTGTPANPPTPIADYIENLSFSYDIVNSGAPTGTYPLGPGDAPTPASWGSGSTAGADTPVQIRAVNVTLEARSEYPFVAAPGSDYFHNSLSTQTSIRNLAFVNQFNTKTTATPGP
jgi:prepilin-type N-terminal cleavage/methylation domain-containing protein